MNQRLRKKWRLGSPRDDLLRSKFCFLLTGVTSLTASSMLSHNTSKSRRTRTPFQWPLGHHIGEFAWEELVTLELGTTHTDSRGGTNR